MNNCMCNLHGGFCQILVIAYYYYYYYCMTRLWANMIEHASAVLKLVEIENGALAPSKVKQWGIFTNNGALAPPNRYQWGFRIISWARSSCI